MFLMKYKLYNDSLAMKKIKQTFLHPALLLAAGNTALAFESAEKIAVTINLILVGAIITSRITDVYRKRSFGVPFIILAFVNFFTAASIIYSGVTSNNRGQLIYYIAPLAFVAWGVGHILAGRLEKSSSETKYVHENPQLYYGIGDMSAVNASGAINPFAFPFMILGFIKSLFIGTKIDNQSKIIKFIDIEFTAARLYSVGFIIGALTSLSFPYFVVAQIFWAVAYLQFRRDTCVSKAC